MYFASLHLTFHLLTISKVYSYGMVWEGGIESMIELLEKSFSLIFYAFRDLIDHF